MAAEANTSTLSTNLNVTPYYDDFSETKNFHRILFRPGLAVQARELTQMQTILQNQIDRFAEHIFKEGSIVRGCEVNTEPNYQYVKLRDNNSTGTSIDVSSFLNKTIKGVTSGVLATVVKTNDGSEANTPNHKTFFVKYISANTSTGYRYFANNEIINGVGASATGLSANTIVSSATGAGYAVTINSGIVYARDHFIRVPEQTVVVSKYSTTPSAKIGYTITEEIITETSDSTLLDPASGSYNYAAPGAARLKLTPVLSTRALAGDTSNTFVELLRVQRGEIIAASSTKTQYAAIRDYLAQRTADESGDYVVSGFLGNVREHLKSGNNYGVYTAGEGGSTNKLVVEFLPGKAYVKGYDIEKLVSTRVDIDKGLDVRSTDNAKTFVDYGNYVIVDNVVGEWDLEGQAKVSLRTTQANAVSNNNYSSTSFPGAEIGTARVRAVEHYTGIPGSASAQYKVYLTDVRMTTAGKSFANVQSICYNSASADGKADIILANGKNANTSDASFDVALFRLPSRATKRLTDSSGNVDNDFAIFRVYSASAFTTGATAQITSADASETFDGTVGVALSDDTARAKFYVTVRSAANTAPANGTISMSGNTITGSSTAFDTQFNVGDIVNVSNGDHIVSEITNATTMKVLGAGATVGAGTSIFKKFKPGQVLDMGGYGKKGSRTITLASSTVVDFDLKEALRQSLPVTIIAQQNKSDATVASKAIQRNRVVQIRVGAGGGTSYTANVTGPWPLGVSDGFRLVRVRKLTGANFTANSQGTDVTSHFYLDNGQRDNFYDHVRLVKKPTSALSIASGDRMLVTFDYFTHSYPGSVNLFTVGSYPVNDSAPLGANIATSQIPVYVSPTTGTSYDLRDCIDFRPRITDTANNVSHSGTITNTSINPLVANSFVASMSGGLHFSPPGEDFTTDLEYYLPRRDLIVMDKNGAIRSIRGIADTAPRTPGSGAEYMNLASIYIPPYPSLATQTARTDNRYDYAVKYSPIKNDRFTMKDIGVIRDRVEKLEYYTSLSLLEKHSADLIIRDTSGNDRFKNGILVDGFKGHNIGNVYDYDYSISVDRLKNELRPRFSSDSIDLFYKAADSSGVVRTNVTTAGVSKDQILFISNSQIGFANGATLNSGQAKLTYKVDNRLYIENANTTFSPGGTVTDGTLTATISSVQTVAPGALITLPYTHEVLVRQPYATTTRNLAGSAYSWIGNLTLDPDNDFWTDQTRRPDVNVNFENLLDNLVASVAPFVNQTEWANWQTTNIGVPTFGQTRLVGSEIDTVVVDGLFNTELVSTYEQAFSRIDTQSRTGIQTSLVLGDARQQSIGDYVRDVNIQPKMRSREIKFRATGVKPSATYYAFFDDVNVSSFITPTNSLYANTGNEGSTLRSNANGVVYGIYRLPSTDTLSFTAGTKVFRITDNPTNSTTPGAVTTSAETSYTSQGLNAGVGTTVISTRAPTLRSDSVSGTREVAVSGTTRYEERTIVTQQNEDDPLAQTFLVNASYAAKISTSSMFLTKLDIFVATKDSTQPLIVELREIDPVTSVITNRVVPFSRVELSPSQINTSTNGSKPTQVIFPAPVHLVNGSEYMIVLRPGGGSPNYTVFTAELGQIDLITKAAVNSQPASGILFTSANERAWTPNEREDLKFTAYYAKFDTSAAGTVVMKNADVDYLVVANTTGTFSKTGETIHGETRLVGTFANTKAVNTGVTYVQGMTSGATGTISGFSSSVITVRNVSTTAKFRGGEAVRIRNTNPTAGIIVGNSSGGITSATTPVGKMYVYDVVNYANTKMVVANVAYINSGSACTSSRLFAPNTYIRGQTDGYSARIVAIENKQVDLINLNADIITPSNTTVLSTAKFATATNAIDSSYFGVNQNDNTEFRASRLIISRSNEGNTTVTSATMNSTRSAQIRFTLTSNNIVASPVIDTGRASIVAVHNLINSNSAIGDSEDYVTSGGDAQTRYISRRVTLADGQDAEDLVVYVTAYKPSTAQVHVYYKILHAEDSDTFAQARWIPMTLSSDSSFYSSSENPEDFIELQYGVPAFAATTSLPYAFGANTTNSNIVEYRNSAKARFVGFKQFAVKIVMTNSETVNPPRLKDLRVIALQR